jgi:hypothetical protein
VTERAQRLLLWALAVALVAGTAIALRFARGYRAVAGLESATAGLPPNVSLRLDGIRAEGRKDNRRAWTLRADRIETTRNHDRIDFVGHIEARLLRNGAPRATITAPSASYTDVNKSLTAAGKIVVLVHSVLPNVKEDLRIETEKVNWNVGAREVDCPGTVRASLGDSEVTGTKLNVDLATRAYSLHDFDARFSLRGEEIAPGRPFGGLLP